MTDIKFIEEYTNNDKAITDDKLEYLQCNSKLKGYVGERQSGKTFLLYQDLVCNAFNIKGDYLVIAPNYPELKLVQDYIKKCLDNFLLDYKNTISYPNYTIRELPNGSTITFINSHNLDNFSRGRKFDYIYIDEPRYMEDIFNNIVFLAQVVLRRHGQLSVFGTMNQEFTSELEQMGFNLIYGGDNNGKI